MYSCKVFASLIIHIQLESSVPSLNNEISQQDGDLCCGPRFLGGGAKGEEEISTSANTLGVDAGYLGSTCKPPCEQQGTKVLMKAFDRRVGLAAVVAGA